MDSFTGNKILVLNSSKIETNYPGGVIQWKTDNPGIVTEEIKVASSNCTHGKMIGVLSVFDDPKTQLTWLRDNTKFICFEESYNYIESSHKANNRFSEIDDQITVQITNLNDKIPDVPHANKISLKEIIDTYKINFDTYNYEKMLCVSLTKETESKYKLDMSFESDLEPGKVYYSSPFFRSIFKKYNVIDFDNFIFYFAAITVNGKPSIGFRADYYKMIVDGFYDYSTNPGSGTGTGGGGGGLLYVDLELAPKINFL